MSEEASNSFNPLQDIKKATYQLYIDGKLSVYAIFTSLLSNYIFFEYPTGYELYFFLPLIAVVGLYLTQYWEKRDQRFMMVLAVLLIILSAGIDLLVGLTFFIWYQNIYRYWSLVSIFLNTVAIIAFIGWIFDYKTDSPILDDPISEEDEALQDNS